jgi:hypothetical protein
VNSYDGLCAIGVAKAVARRLGGGLGPRATLRLSLREPYHVDGDKKQSEEKRASNKVRNDRSKPPFIHP